MEIQTKETIILDAFGTNSSLLAIDIRKLASSADEVSFPSNEIVLNLNQPQKVVYLIIKGLARSYYLGEDGNSVTKDFMLEVDFLIEESFF